MEELSPLIVHLKLGSQIDITSDKVNGIFLITYIDDDKIKIDNENDSFVLNIEDHRIAGVKNITLLKNPLEEGYARQNGLVEGAMIDITFNVDGEMEHLIGEIIGLEEDCIEVRLESNEIIYIDFGYIGIPENLNISEIEVITEQKPVKEENSLQILLEEGNKIGDFIFLVNFGYYLEISSSNSSNT
jgi:ribosomal protein S8E